MVLILKPDFVHGYTVILWPNVTEIEWLQYCSLASYGYETETLCRNFVNGYYGILQPNTKEIKWFTILQPGLVYCVFMDITQWPDITLRHSTISHYSITWYHNRGTVLQAGIKSTPMEIHPYPCKKLTDPSVVNK